MAEFSGTALYATWQHPAGTLVLNTDYRQFNDQPSVNLLNARAGNDQSESYLVDTKDGQVTYTGLAQNGGTVLITALTEGVSGTLVFGEEGTAVGKPKTTIPAICMGLQRNIQYNQLVEFSVTFQQNGTRTYGTY
jgi:hypothetical protein